MPLVAASFSLGLVAWHPMRSYRWAEDDKKREHPLREDRGGEGDVVYGRIPDQLVLRAAAASARVRGGGSPNRQGASSVLSLQSEDSLPYPLGGASGKCQQALEQAQAALTPWQQRQGRARGQRSGLEARGQRLTRAARWMMRADRPVPKRTPPGSRSPLRIMPWRTGCPYRSGHGQKIAVRACNGCVVWFSRPAASLTGGPW